MVARVLVVDDEDQIRRVLDHYLRAEGFEVAEAATGRDALALVATRATRPDIVLLDIGLADMTGLEVLARIRADSDLPVILVTARTEEVDTLVGFSVGADDYVTKPFSHRELLARVRAVLRRGVDTELMPDVIEGAGVRMDVERHEVWVDGEPVRLALKEFELLEMLLRNAGRVMTRGQLIDRIWGADYVGDTKTLDVHIKRLRGKIEADPANPGILVTVRGLGYKFNG